MSRFDHFGSVEEVTVCIMWRTIRRMRLLTLVMAMQEVVFLLHTRPSLDLFLTMQ